MTPPISLGVVASSSGSSAGTITTFTWVDDGNGAATSATFTVAFSGGSGTGATFTVARTTKVANQWYITNVTLSNGGSGYTVGNTLTYTDNNASPVNNITVTVTGVS